MGEINNAPDTNRTAEAAQNVPPEAGKVQASPDSPGKAPYKADDISFLMRAPVAR